MRTQGVGEALLRSDPAVTVVDGDETLEFQPTSSQSRTGLIFLCGSGVSAAAYAPLVRPIAAAGYPVIVVRLPYRFAPFESHKEEAVARVRRLIASRKPPDRWVLAGHSLGAALAARFAKTDYQSLSGLVLIGTTHPKEDDLSFLPIPVTKVYATNDGVAPADRVMANKGLLPARTTWVAIQGGNHSQFGHYGHQLFDRKAEISRKEQQALTRAALLRALADAG